MQLSLPNINSIRANVEQFTHEYKTHYCVLNYLFYYWKNISGGM